MRFVVLGDVSAAGPHGPISIAAPKQRLLLAILLSHCPAVVSADTLIDALWGAAAPATAKNSLADHIRRLRHTLGDKTLIRWEGSGYRISDAAIELDSQEFEAGYARAHAATSPAQTAEILHAALALWTGPAYGDVAEHAAVAAEAIRLDGMRLSAIEKHVEARLNLGDHAALIDELAAEVARNPFRDRLRAQLMLALYRCGRPAEALDLYRQGRDEYVAELGLEPGSELRELQHAILTGAASLDPPPQHSPTSPAPVPAELPPPAAGFSGRDTETRLLRQALLKPAGPKVAAIYGPGGVGKSALAIQVAGSLADRFPDGRLYVNLRGATPDVAPLRPLDVLARFLRSLGCDVATLTDLDEASARFRSATADRTLLVVLDDAHDIGQVRPLLPSGDNCAVLITSRKLLSSLESGTHFPLRMLTETASVELLNSLIDAERAGAEPEALREVAALCGHLPLALCIATARLRARPHWTVASLAERLRTEDRRLRELEVDDRAVRASFAVSYRDLDRDGSGAAAARMFRLLGLHDGPHITVPVAAALAAASQTAAEEWLELLTDAQLIEPHGPGRYRIHDLLRLFAKRRAVRVDSDVDRTGAVNRLLDHFLAGAQSAARILDAFEPFTVLRGCDSCWPAPELTGPSHAGRWLVEEFGNLQSAIRLATRHPPDGPAIAVELAGTLARLQPVHGRHTDLLDSCELATTAARRTRDPAVLAAALAAHGELLRSAGRDMEAVEMLARARQSARLARRGDVEVYVLSRLAETHRQRGELDAALAAAEAAASRAGESGLSTDHSGEVTLLGFIHRDRGDYTAAVAAFRDAAGSAAAAGRRLRQATRLRHLAEAFGLAGKLAEAAGCYREAVASLDDSGHGRTFLRASLTWDLGDTLHATGEGDTARQCWRQALDIAHGIRAIGDAEFTATVSAIGSPRPPERPAALARP